MCGGWAVHHLLNSTDTTLSGQDVVEALVAVLIEVPAGLAAVVAAGFGLSHLARRFLRG